ncbi:MAG TPA: hypothetical protein EYN13_03250 [Methylococcales bacterium]|nr:hypothetical protein [Methylococcales bacterium]
MTTDKIKAEEITTDKVMAGATIAAKLMAGPIKPDNITEFSGTLSRVDINQTNYRLPTELIEKINESVETLGVRNKTQAVIILIEQGLAVNALSESVKEKVFNALMADYQDLSLNEIKNVQKILEGFKNDF